MKTSLLGAALAVGIFAAGCSGNGASPLPGTGTNPNGAFTKLSHTESVPAGWAATATQRVPIKNFPTASVPETTQLRIVVGLRMRDAAGAQQLVRSQFTPGHASFQKWLMPEQFTAKFNPSYKQAHEVAEYLKKQGFTQVEIEPNNLIVSATGSISRAEAAFNTTIRGTVVNGKAVYGNIKPALDARKAQAQRACRAGAHECLSDARASQTSPYTRPLKAGTPPPCLEVVNGICIGGEYGPPQYQVAYDATTVRRLQHRKARHRSR